MTPTDGHEYASLLDLGTGGGLLMALDHASPLELIRYRGCDLDRLRCAAGLLGGVGLGPNQDQPRRRPSDLDLDDRPSHLRPYVIGVGDVDDVGDQSRTGARLKAPGDVASRWRRR